jgi:hypothetical protein
MIHIVALASHPPLYKPVSPRPPLSVLKSLAFWLRSSVVSVLHSLIAVTGLRTVKMIILIFGTCWKTSELAHVFWHSVARIALPRADANLYFFHRAFWPVVAGTWRRILDCVGVYASVLAVV